MTGRWRILSGLALILAYPVLLRVPFAQLPAAVAVVGIEALVIGIVPFGIAFLAQTLLGRRHLGEAALLLVAVAVVFAWWLLGQGPVMPAGESAVTLCMFALFLLWFLSLGAVSARTFRRYRLSRAPSGPREAQQGHRAGGAR